MSQEFVMPNIGDKIPAARAREICPATFGDLKRMERRVNRRRLSR